MRPLSARDLCDVVRGDLLSGSPEAAVSGVTTDSRWVPPGSAFFALDGRRTDGHRYVAEAFRSGASAAVVARTRTASPGPADGAVVGVEDPLAALQLLEEQDPYARLDALGRRLRDAVLAAAAAKGIPVQVPQKGSMFSVFFNASPVIAPIPPSFLWPYASACPYSMILPPVICAPSEMVTMA